MSTINLKRHRIPLTEPQLELTYSQAYRAQLRDVWTYLDQIANLIGSACRYFGWWAVMTSSITAGGALVAFISMDLSIYSTAELQSGLRLSAIGAGFAAAISGMIANVGSFRDVFGDRAMHKVQLIAKLKQEAEERTEEIERLLVHHKLISEEDVQRRVK